MIRRVVPLLLAGCCAVLPVAAERLHVELSGHLLDFALQDTGDGDPVLWFLVQPLPVEEPETDEVTDEDRERRLPDCPVESGDREPNLLVRLDREGDGVPTVVRSDLPWNAGRLTAADLDGDGRDELVLGIDDDEAPGLYIVDGGTRSILDRRHVVWNEEDPAVAASPGIGTLTLYRYDPDAGRFVSRADYPMPLDAAVGPGRILLAAQAVLRLEPSEGPAVYATPPKPFGRTRLRTTLIRPDAGQVVESWARLPGPEELMDARYRVLDGEPVLVVQTRNAEKLALFGEKQVRIYPLQADRSRSGFRPLMAAATGMNLWQEGTPWILDVNRDGRDDLVLGYWKGLKDDRVVLEAYLRNPDGTFRDRPRTTAFDVDDGDRSYVAFGRDLNGDSLPDLVVSGAAGVLLYPGLPGRTGRKLVDGDPVVLSAGDSPDPDRDGSVTVTIGGDGTDVTRSGPRASRPRFLDLDRDGRMEVVLLRKGSGQQPGTFTALFLD